MIFEYSSSDSFRELISSDNIVLVDFYAGWCEPCKWLDVILNEIEPDLPSNSLIIKVDIELHQDLADSYGVRSVPVLAIFKSGSVLWRMNGFLMGPDLLAKVKSFV